MHEEIYRKLAERLDAIPNGFPATKSGVERKLLAKIFTPDEAVLALGMRVSSDPVERIAERAHVDVREAGRLLRDMARRGLVRVKRRDRQLVFGLMPFIVGFYEEQLPRMDEELAGLVEAYLQEAHEAFYGKGPSVHRVIPVERAIPFELEIFPHEGAVQLVEKAKSWGVRKCICRVQQRLVGRACHHEVENCLLLAPMEGAFARSEITRPIAKEDALRILEESEEAGLITNTANHREGIYYLCNCCSCCCGVIRGLTEFGIPAAVAKSDFRITLDAEACTGCGACEERCYFGALSTVDGHCEVRDGWCVGCGLCVSACPLGALVLERRPTGEVPAPKETIKEWMSERAERRGIATADVL